jgi:hypothetical protein
MEDGRMAADEEITELVEFVPTRVDGVESPANGTPFLILKARAEDESAEDDSDEGTEDESSAEKATEAEEIGEEVVGEATKADELTPNNDSLTKSEREEMPAKHFAYISPDGERHLPVHDEGHVRAALGRFSQTDFSGADDPAAAKAKAARKIAAAAKDHGIELDDKSAVAQAAKSTGVPEVSVAEPEKAGVIDGSDSGLGPTMTDGKWVRAENSSEFLGGETPYAIPTIGKVKTEEIPTTTDGAGLWTAKSITAASLLEAMDGLVAQRQAMKDNLGPDGVLQLQEPAGEEAAAPSSMPWESYDAATYSQVAQVLAEACHALEALEQRELVEGVTGDESDFSDAAETACAREALDCAIGITARLAFHEMAEATAVKSGRIVSAKNEAALKAARDHINTVLDGVEKTNAGDGETEDMIVTDVSKTELAAMIAQASADAVKEAMNMASNNDGEVSAADIKPTGEAKADEVNSVPDGGHVNPEYVNKSELDEISKSVSAMHEMIEKLSKRPRPGGPVLDGQVRGVEAAAEGRLGEASKGEESEVEKLAKKLEEATDPQARDRLSEKLTYMRLVDAHEKGRF